MMSPSDLFGFSGLLYKKFDAVFLTFFIHFINILYVKYNLHRDGWGGVGGSNMHKVA